MDEPGLTSIINRELKIEECLKHMIVPMIMDSL